MMALCGVGFSALLGRLFFSSPDTKNPFSRPLTSPSPSTLWPQPVFDLSKSYLHGDIFESNVSFLPPLP